MELRIPVDELRLALPEKVAQIALEQLVKDKSDLLTYFDTHINAYKNSPSTPLDFTINRLALVDTQQGQRLSVTATITQPSGKDLGNFVLHYNAISHRVMKHKTLVILNSDFDSGQLSADAEPFGSFDYQHHELSINRAEGSWFTGTESFIELGMEHIDEGLDHLAFIFCLLLLAPLKLINNKWQLAPNRAAVLKALKLVSMFTLGHTATLVLVSFQIITPNASVIEMLICATIMLTALHAIRPLPYFQEYLATLMFGLIHGAAFSETLQNLHFSRGDFILSLAGFNIGIEIAQIAAIALLFPWLLLLKYRLPYEAMKNALGALLLCAAAYWLYERVTHQSSEGLNISGLELYLNVVPLLLMITFIANLPSLMKLAKRMGFPQKI